MSWVSQGIHWVGDHLGGQSAPAPMPGKFNSGPQSPLPVAGGMPGANDHAAIEAQLRNQFGVGDVLDTIKNAGGDVWSWLTQHGVSLASLGGDISKLAGFIKDNKSNILDGLNAYSQYERSKKADQYAKEGLDLSKQHYDAKEPLRVAGMAGMLNPSASTPDLSALKAQGQQGAGMTMPLPVAGASNMANISQLAAGPGSGNAFAKPLAPLPLAGGSPAPPMAPPAPRPTSPLPMSPLPVAGMPPVARPGLAPRPIAPVPTDPNARLTLPLGGS